MSTKTTQKTLLATSATAMSAVGFLLLPVPAQAVPMLPLAPACTQYGFIGDFALRQTNGFRVEFSAKGPSAGGRAQAFNSSGTVAMNGNVSGGITGRHLDFTIRWDNGPRGHYTGDVGEFDFAHGTSVDEANPGSSAGWDSTVPLGCLDAPPAPPPAQPAPVPAPPAPAPQQPAPAPNERPDTDGDGMFDDDEIKGQYTNGSFVTDPNNPDTDGDGVNDGAEDDNGTNPLDPNDF